MTSIPYVHENLEGYKLRVAHAADYKELLMPYFYHEESNPQETFAGVDMSILDYLSRSLNFTYSMQVSVDKEWGSQIPGSSNWTGMIGMVQRQVRKAEMAANCLFVYYCLQDVDMALGMITITPSRALTVDFTWPYATLAILCFFTTEPPPLPKSYSLVWPFR